MITNFINMCINGLASEAQVDDFIDAWHTSTFHGPIWEYLGMTLPEYAQFVNNHSSLSQIIAARTKA